MIHSGKNLTHYNYWLTYIQMACVEQMKLQVRGPTIQSTLKHRIRYNEDTKNPCAKKSAWNMEEMDISSTECQVL